jgi:hypothetical protein
VPLLLVIFGHAVAMEAICFVNACVEFKRLLHEKIIFAERQLAAKSERFWTNDNWKIALFLFVRFRGRVCCA